MAALRGEASFQAGGRAYSLVYDINAFVEAEEASGSDIDTLLKQLDSGKSIKVLRAMVWAGLQRKHPCHLIEAGEIIAEAGTKEVSAAMLKALAGAFPPPSKEGGKVDPPPAADGTGSAG